MASFWQVEGDGLMLAVRATPRARQDEVVGVWHDADNRVWLSVKVRAAPDDGVANAAVIATVAKAVGLPRSALRLESGHAARLKRIKIVCNTNEIDRLVAALGGE